MLLVQGWISPTYDFVCVLMALFGSQGIVVKCTAAIFFRTVDWILKKVNSLFLWKGKFPWGLGYVILTWKTDFNSSIFIYTWFFENRVNESFIFFEVVLILRLSLKDTVPKLRSKEVFLFMSAVFLHLLQQLVAWEREAKKKQMQKKGNA